MGNDIPHSLNLAFTRSDAAKPSRLESHYQQMREKTEHKIAELQMAADVCEKMGYDVNDVPIHLLEQAISDVSQNNGRAGGDWFKPFDQDLAFADEAGLKSWFERELPQKGIKPVPKSDQAILDFE